ncbi:MAG: SagB/ThcOx family dehydrogenase [Bacteroidales bacterium]|nr:SagB/ThcOx family dehydrogenase [Bacteroidales bacterium]
MKTFYTSIFITFLTLTTFSQIQQKIVLNQPDTSRGYTVMHALANRASEKEYDTINLSLQDLSDLMWAANGVNRPEEKNRTAPSAINGQDIDIYAFMIDGVYFYNAFDHILELVVEGDYRDIVAGSQYWVADAPVICVLVSDISRFKFGDDDQRMLWAAFDAGIVSQNISVFCASVGLATRPRASMEIDKIIDLLNLTETQHPMLNNPVGYPLK